MGNNGKTVINAWNEWAEGCHIEPDAYWDDSYLLATRSALASVQNLHVMMEKIRSNNSRNTISSCLLHH